MPNMTVTDHLEALRAMFIRILLILTTAFIGCLAVSNYVTELLLRPLRHELGDGGKIIYLSVFDKVVSEFQVAFWTAIIVSAPFWLWQVWKFVRPALTDAEKKMVRPFVVVGFLLFYAGVLFGNFLVFPFALKTLMNMGVKNVEPALGLKQYLHLSSSVLVLLGFIFQLPNLIIILGTLGIVNRRILSELRRYAYVGFGIFAMVVTPTTDAITMMLLWVPLVVLFEIGAIALVLFVRAPLKQGENLCSE